MNERKEKWSMIKPMVETLKPVKLDCGIEVNKYLNYAQIQQIVNAVVRFVA